MATTKPRITITITHRQHELLKAISEATGASMSANVSELLETCEPVLERIANTMQKLQSINAQRKASVAAALDEAQSALEARRHVPVDVRHASLPLVRPLAGAVLIGTATVPARVGRTAQSRAVRARKKTRGSPRRAHAPPSPPADPAPGAATRLARGGRRGPCGAGGGPVVAPAGHRRRRW